MALSFSETVTVTGEPRVRLEVGDRKRWARYSGGSGSATLAFAYTVKGSDRDDDGIHIGENMLQLKGGSIEDGDGNGANLSHPALAAQAGHKVNGAPPSQGEPVEPQPEPEPTPTPTPEPAPANSEPQFDDGESTTRGVDENAAVGANVGDPVAATDADGDALTYALTGSGAFAISETAGQIAVAETLDHETQSSYLLTVTVSDGKNASGEADTGVDASITVTINVGNLDETGTVSLDSQTPQAGSVLSASLSDPDGGVSGATWSWAGSADGTDWTAITGASAQTYTPSDDDVGRYLQATVSYTDGQGSGKSASAGTASAVTAAPPPEPEPPQITAGPVIISSPESGDTYGKDQAIVVAVTFSEAVTVSGQPRVRLAVGQRHRWARYDHARQDGTVLVFAYKVKGNDQDADGISIGADQLGLNRGSIEDGDGNAAVLSHPALAAQAGHQVDGSQEAPADGQEHPHTNSQPAFAADTLTINLEEYLEVGQSVGSPVAATDADGDALTYTLQGRDYLVLNINRGTGQLLVRFQMHFRDALGRIRATSGYDGWIGGATNKPIYHVQVAVSDGKADDGSPDNSIDDTIDVTVKAFHVDTPGTITFNTTSPPQTRYRLTALLSDLDENITSLTWKWEVSADRTNWSTATGATSTTPETDRPIFTRHSGNGMNTFKWLNDKGKTRSHYTPVAADVGKYLRVTASYTDWHGPGKTTRATTSAVVAGPAASVPQFAAANAFRSVAENSAPATNIGSPLTATDSDNDTMTYALTGLDAGSFTIDTATGQIKVKDALNYEEKNSYSVTVAVSDGKGSGGGADNTVDDTIPVTVQVVNVDEPGRLVLNADNPQVGKRITTELTDPDVIRLWAYRWLRSKDASNWGAHWDEVSKDQTCSWPTQYIIKDDTGSFPWDDYTPRAEDVGYYLRVWVRYTDQHDKCTWLAATTTNPVAAP